MVVGIQTQLFADKKNRQIFYIKKTGNYYVLKNKEEFYVKLLQNNIVNAISISVILGLFLHLDYIWYIAIAIALYIAYLIFFNLKVMANLSPIKAKHIERNAKPVNEKKQMLLQGIGLPFVGIALMICLLTGQVQDEMTKMVVLLCILMSFMFGLKTLVQLVRKLKNK